MYSKYGAYQQHVYGEHFVFSYDSFEDVGLCATLNRSLCWTTIGRNWRVNNRSKEMIACWRASLTRFRQIDWRVRPAPHKKRRKVHQFSDCCHWRPVYPCSAIRADSKELSVYLHLWSFSSASVNMKSPSKIHLLHVTQSTQLTAIEICGPLDFFLIF